MELVSLHHYVFQRLQMYKRKLNDYDAKLTTIQEYYENQIALETAELEASPEEEKMELVLLYQAKGMTIDEARNLADKAFESKDSAIETLITEELGINKEELEGSAWEAGITSFILFSIGAIIPLYPFMFLDGKNAIYLSIGSSVVGLFGIGAAIGGNAQLPFETKSPSSRKARRR